MPLRDKAGMKSSRDRPRGVYQLLSCGWPSLAQDDSFRVQVFSLSTYMDLGIASFCVELRTVHFEKDLRGGLDTG